MGATDAFESNDDARAKFGPTGWGTLEKCTSPGKGGA